MKNVLITSIILIAIVMVSCNSGSSKSNDTKASDSLSKMQTASVEPKSDEACCEEGATDGCSTDEACESAKGNKSSCCNNEKVSVSDKVSDKSDSKLLVYAFHGTRQCTTCKNMKSHAKQALDAYFSKEMKSGEIQYFIIDVDDPKNEALAEKFEAIGTALMVNHIVAGKDHISDWSDFAFDKANDKEVFMPEFKRLIEQELKH